MGTDEELSALDGTLRHIGKVRKMTESSAICMQQGGQMGTEGNPCMHARLTWSRSAWGVAHLVGESLEVPEVAETMVTDGGI